MSYRVRDTRRNRWINSNVYLTPHNELYFSKRLLFNWVRLVPEEDDRYVVHMSTRLYDKNDVLIYEGDFVKAQVSEDRTVNGMVAFAHELSAYILLCPDTNEYFTIGMSVSKDIEVIGNVFDGYAEDK